MKTNILNLVIASFLLSPECRALFRKKNPQSVEFENSVPQYKYPNLLDDHLFMKGIPNEIATEINNLINTSCETISSDNNRLEKAKPTDDYTEEEVSDMFRKYEEACKHYQE